MKYWTLDFAGLTDEELSEASPVIGSTAMIKLADVPSSLDEIEDTDAIEPITVVVQWGDPRIDQILNLVRLCRDIEEDEPAWLLDGQHLALVLNERIRIGTLVAKHNMLYDEQAEEVIPKRFDPVAAYEGAYNVYIAPWEAEEAQRAIDNWETVWVMDSVWVDINDDFYMQWHLSTSLRPEPDLE